MSIYNLQSALNNEEIITKINELFHDVEAETYESSHPEIFDYETVDWNKLFKKIRSEQFSEEPIVVLDVGTGTGFVPLAISNNLSTEDKVIMTDISSGMLIKADISLKNLFFKKEFILIEDNYASIPSTSVDVITMNSVLHHIPNVEKLFFQLQRILKPGGCLIIKHEPNIRFVQNKILRLIYLSLKKLRDFKLTKSEPDFSHNPMFEKVLLKLENNGICFEKPLTQSELQSLVDIHSPTAGGSMSTSRGFDPFELVEDYLNQSTLIDIKTYGFFGKIRDDSNSVRRTIASILRTVFPKDGYFFDVVIIKNK